MATPSKHVRWPDPSEKPDTTSLRWRGVLTDEWLRPRWERGDTLAEIGQEAGCCEITVRRFVDRLGLPARETPKRRGPRSWEDVLTPEFLHAAYVEDGMTMQAIAADVGCPPGTVSRLLHRHGIPTRRARPGVDNLLYLEALPEEVVRTRAESGTTLIELALEGGCSTTAAKGAARRAGVSGQLPGSRPPEDLCASPEELRRLYGEEHLSLEAIAARLGVSRIKVRADLDRAGIRPYTRPPHSRKARAKRAAEDAAIDPAEVVASYAALRRRWRPRRVRLLLLNASPPHPLGRDPHFYAPDHRIDPLFRAVTEALYGADDSGGPLALFEQMRRDGIWLLDACPTPFSAADPTQRRRELRAHRSDFIQECLDAKPAHGAVLCHQLVWTELRRALQQAGVTLLHEEPIPYPLVNPRGFVVALREIVAAMT
jgi:transposase-like protein